MYVVEQICDWRDHLRYIALLNPASQKPLKKRKIISQTSPNSPPYLTGDNINYLVKMKQDTSGFRDLGIARFFNFSDTGRGDPLLICPSLQNKNSIAAGSGIAAM